MADDEPEFLAFLDRVGLSRRHVTPDPVLGTYCLLTPYQKELAVWSGAIHAPILWLVQAIVDGRPTSDWEPVHDWRTF